MSKKRIYAQKRKSTYKNTSITQINILKMEVA